MLHLPTDWYIQSWKTCIHNSKKVQVHTTWLFTRTRSAARAPPVVFEPMLAAVNRTLNYFNFTFHLQKYTAKLHAIIKPKIIFNKFPWWLNNIARKFHVYMLNNENRWNHITLQFSIYFGHKIPYYHLFIRNRYTMSQTFFRSNKIYYFCRTTY